MIDSKNNNERNTRSSSIKLPQHHMNGSWIYQYFIWIDGIKREKSSSSFHKLENNSCRHFNHQFGIKMNYQKMNYYYIHKRWISNTLFIVLQIAYTLITQFMCYNKRFSKNNFSSFSKLYLFFTYIKYVNPIYTFSTRQFLFCRSMTLSGPSCCSVLCTLFR